MHFFISRLSKVIFTWSLEPFCIFQAHDRCQKRCTTWSHHWSFLEETSVTSRYLSPSLSLKRIRAISRFIRLRKKSRLRDEQIMSCECDLRYSEKFVFPSDLKRSSCVLFYLQAETEYPYSHPWIPNFFRHLNFKSGPVRYHGAIAAARIMCFHFMWLSNRKPNSDEIEIEIETTWPRQEQAKPGAIPAQFNHKVGSGLR